MLKQMVGIVVHAVRVAEPWSGGVTTPENSYFKRLKFNINLIQSVPRSKYSPPRLQKSVS